MTTEGEVIGLFLTGDVPPHLSPEETMDRIHAMGGLTYLPHPLDRRRAHFSPERVVELAPRVDIIETYNSWCPAVANQAAADLAAGLGMVTASGSDAHAPHEMGHSWQEMEPFDGPEDFLAKLARSRAVRTPASGTQRRA
ncbi:MAG: PHP domain-containing protein [Candidatus Dormibacteraceae bacterium]